MTLQDWDRLRVLYGDALIPLIEGLMKRKRHPTLHTVAFSKAIHWLHEDAKQRFPLVRPPHGIHLGLISWSLFN